MQTHRVNIAIPADKYVALYTGSVQNVRAESEEGLKVIFPGSILHRYVGHEGVYGCFEIVINSDNKFQSIRRLR